MATERSIREAVLAAVDEVGDPRTDGSVRESGLVDGVAVDDGEVTLRLAEGGLDHETLDRVTERIRQAALETPGVDRAVVEGGEDDGGVSVPLSDVDTVIAVASAKGGVGKTTVASQLARGLSERGQSVGLFDADLYGPNVPELFGANGPLETTADGDAAPIRRHGVALSSVGLLGGDGTPLAWRGAMVHEALIDLLDGTAWGDLDTLVLDLPPGTGDVVLTTLQEVRVDAAVLVTTPAPTALADLRRSVELFEEYGLSVLGTVVNMARTECPHCGEDHDVFPADTEAVPAERLVELPMDEELTDVAGSVHGRAADLAAAVAERADAATTPSVPADAMDLRGVPGRIGIEQTETEVRAADPGETTAVVTSRDPSSLGEAVADAVGPDAVDWSVDRLGPERWLLRLARTL